MDRTRRIAFTAAGRGDPAFPDVDAHLGMILGMNSIDAAKQLDPETARMRLKFLEDKSTVMQARNQNLITENASLADRLREESTRSQKLEEELAVSREELSRERSKLVARERQECEKRERVESKDDETSTSDFVGIVDRGVQAWAVCRACQRKLDGCGNCEPTVVITKSELENLEVDMQALRDAVVAREEAWDRAVEREQNYHQQLTRLLAEAATNRHVSDSLRSEVQTVTLALEEKESELRATQKDLMHLKKIVVKLEKRQRDREESFDSNNANVPSISEREQNMIEDITRRLSSAKGKPKSRTRSDNRDRPMGSTAPPSLQNSPRRS